MVALRFAAVLAPVRLNPKGGENGGLTWCLLPAPPGFCCCAIAALSSPDGLAGARFAEIRCGAQGAVFGRCAQGMTIKSGKELMRKRAVGCLFGAALKKIKSKKLGLHERVRGCDRTRSRVYGCFVGCAVPVPPNTKPKRYAGFLMVRCWTGNG